MQYIISLNRSVKAVPNLHSSTCCTSRSLLSLVCVLFYKYLLKPQNSIMIFKNVLHISFGASTSLIIFKLLRSESEQYKLLTQNMKFSKIYVFLLKYVLYKIVKPLVQKKNMLGWKQSKLNFYSRQFLMILFK